MVPVLLSALSCVSGQLLVFRIATLTIPYDDYVVYCTLYFYLTYTVSLFFSARGTMTPDLVYVRVQFNRTWNIIYGVHQERVAHSQRDYHNHSLFSPYLLTLRGSPFFHRSHHNIGTGEGRGPNLQQ